MEKKEIIGKILAAIKEYTVKFLRWFLSDWKNFAIAILLVLFVVFYLSYKSMENKYDNVIIQKDRELTEYKNKQGELYAQMETYVTDIKNLKISNSELYDEVHNLKENPIIVTKVTTKEVIKEIKIHDTINVVGDDVYDFGFSFKDQWFGLDGRSTINTTTLVSDTYIDSLYFSNNLTLDLIEKGKEISFIVKSDNPYCQINKINGAVISPEKSKVLKKRFDSKWCVVAGVGPGLTIIDGSFRVVPAVNVTIGRKIFGF